MVNPIWTLKRIMSIHLNLNMEFYVTTCVCNGVALADKANAINCLFQKESIVALIGMGGIGKTTLSKKMYHLFHDKYD